MSRNGQLALKRVIFNYGITAGSPALRQALAQEVQDFKRTYPSVEIDVRVRREPIPTVTGVYRDGSERCMAFHLDPGRAIFPQSAQAIWLKLHMLASSANESDLPDSSKNSHMQRTSVQGTWNPWLWSAEGHEHREVPKSFDRELTDNEWNYYVDEYSKEMKTEHDAVKEEVQRRTKPYEEDTEEIAQRWKKYVAPTRQTDLEHNLEAMKAKGKKKFMWKGDEGKVSFEEYSLFANRDLDTTTRNLVSGLRQKDQEDLSTWWKRRKEQLNPPK